MKDWIDLGETPYNPLWLGTSAQSGIPAPVTPPAIRSLINVVETPVPAGLNP